MVAPYSGLFLCPGFLCLRTKPSPTTIDLGLGLIPAFGLWAASLLCKGATSGAITGLGSALGGRLALDFVATSPPPSRALAATPSMTWKTWAMTWPPAWPLGEVSWETVSCAGGFVYFQ